MRELFVWFLKLQAWLSLLGAAVYGYLAASGYAETSDKYLFGMIGLFVGLLAGSIAWVMYKGLADLAATIWGNEEKLQAIQESLDQRSRREES